MASLVSIHLCSICDRPVDLRTCKTDEFGKAVHEACYTARLALENVRRKEPVRSTGKLLPFPRTFLR